MSNTLTGTGGTPSMSSMTDHHTFACLFATRAEAERAQAALIADGVPSSDIKLIDRGVSGTTTGANPLAPSHDESFWGSLKSLFTGNDDDVAGYGEGITRGHALLSVTTTAAKADHVADTLERFNPIDLDAQEATWRKEGWTGTMATSGMATGAVLGTAPAAMTETARTDAAMLTGKTGTAPVGMVNDKGEQVFQTVEEELLVGKRDVSRGSVRVRSYVVSRPVMESVSLRQEHVTIERRPATGTGVIGEDAFRERTIEMTETGEEAVISKTAHVTGEVAIKKTVEQRTQEVSDTVRRTEVEIEDERGVKTTTGPTTTTSTTKTDTTKPRI